MSGNFLHRVMASFGLVLLLVFMYPVASAARGIVVSDTYRDCVALSKENPGAALSFAEGWLKRERSAAALHCKSVALFAQKRYGAAARALDILHDKLPPDEVRLRLDIRRQAARGWRKSGERVTAFSRLDDAVLRLLDVSRVDPVLARMLVETLLERSRLHHEAGDDLRALHDLDHAASLNIIYDRVLLERARLYALIGQQELAVADLQALLRINPDNHEARRLLEKVVK